ncbi:hypothetical protein [Hymenobacter rubidus]|uniref:hypothetical protein n=1 Tax=Hymenobacter rubidus TaxID=1441626 RepID=UPI00191DB162|nr:hypothetical protein [Hymenobacter rubidus]
MPEVTTLKNATNRPALVSLAWPIGLNLVLLLLLLGNCLQSEGPDGWSMLAVIMLTIAVNLLGALVALVQRKWALAVWYGLALLVVLGLQWVALTVVEIPLNRRIVT